MTCYREKLPERPPKPAKYRNFQVNNNSIKEDFQFLRSDYQVPSKKHHTLKVQPELLVKESHHHHSQYIARTTTTTVLCEQSLTPVCGCSTCVYCGRKLCYCRGAPNIQNHNEIPPPLPPKPSWLKTKNLNEDKKSRNENWIRNEINGHDQIIYGKNVQIKNKNNSNDDRKSALNAHDLLKNHEKKLKEELSVLNAKLCEIGEKLKNVAPLHIVDKYELHNKEVEMITALLYNLASRISRTESQIRNNNYLLFSQNELEVKRGRLKMQLKEALYLKRLIHKRSTKVSEQLGEFLDKETGEIYQNILEKKIKIIVELREIKEQLHSVSNTQINICE